MLKKGKRKKEKARLSIKENRTKENTLKRELQ